MAPEEVPTITLSRAELGLTVSNDQGDDELIEVPIGDDTLLQLIESARSKKVL